MLQVTFLLTHHRASFQHSNAMVNFVYVFVSSLATVIKIILYNLQNVKILGLELESISPSIPT